MCLNYMFCHILSTTWNKFTTKKKHTMIESLWRVPIILELISSGTSFEYLSISETPDLLRFSPNRSLQFLKSTERWKSREHGVSSSSVWKRLVVERDQMRTSRLVWAAGTDIVTQISTLYGYGSISRTHSTSKLRGVEPDVVSCCSPRTTSVDVLCVLKCFSVHHGCKEWLRATLKSYRDHTFLPFWCLMWTLPEALYISWMI